MTGDCDATAVDRTFRIDRSAWDPRRCFGSFSVQWRLDAD
jgi:hypothetical protein